MAVAVATSVSNDTIDAMIDSMNTSLSTTGIIEFWEGALPATCAAGEGGGDTLLCTLPLTTTAFSDQTGGVFQLNTIAPGTVDVSGDVGYFRIKTAGNVCIMQGDCGTSGADIDWNTTSWTAADDIELTALIFTSVIVGN